jgi:hypothetical protein
MGLLLPVAQWAPGHRRPRPTAWIVLLRTDHLPLFIVSMPNAFASPFSGKARSPLGSRIWRATAEPRAGAFTIPGVLSFGSLHRGPSGLFGVRAPVQSLTASHRPMAEKLTKGTAVQEFNQEVSRHRLLIPRLLGLLPSLIKTIHTYPLKPVKWVYLAGACLGQAELKNGDNLIRIISAPHGGGAASKGASPSAGMSLD